MSTAKVLTRRDFLRATGLYWLAGLVVAVWAVRRALQNEALRFRFHLFLLRIPVLGRFALGMLGVLAAGYVARESESDRYRSSGRLISLGQAASETFELTRVATAPKCWTALTPTLPATKSTWRRAAGSP